MKAATLRTFTIVHTWAGLLSGFALFIAFYAGALSVFHDEIDLWAVPHVEAQHDRMAQAGRLIAEAVATHPAAKAQIGLTLPATSPSAGMALYWLDGGTWMAQSLDEATPRDAEDHEHGLADFIYDLHYTLGIPVAGIYLMGIVSIIYGLALLTGLLIHLPNLVRELFALRPGHNLKRLWQDAHNVIGVLSLPFHIVFAVTGALLCLTTVTLLAFNTLAFDGKLMTAFDHATSAMPVVVASGKPGTMLSPEALVERARAAALAAGAAGFEPDYMRYLNYGDAGATAEVRGTSRKTLGEYGMVAMSATDGHVIGVQVPGARDANHATYSAIFGLHFGTFGDLSLRWLYFLLGLAGAFLFYSGNLLYIESRRKRRQPDQPLKVRAMATATVGVCIGSCLAISAAFVANLLAPAVGIQATALVAPVCFSVFFLAIGWTLWRRPARAAVDLLLATAAVTAAIGILDVAMHPARFASAMAQGPWAAPGVDLVAMALAIGFAWLAWATRRRGVEGDPNSVWARRIR
jgi:uncharacterized iron-regulated membrane protein